MSRAGQYIRQLGGYRAFIPAPLPPVPPVQIDAATHVRLSRADRELGRLDGSIQTLPNPDLFVYMYVRKEAVLSSQIEGTQSSLQDLLAAEARVMTAGGADDVGEVVNYVNAMNHGLARLEELPVSVRLLREIHGKLLAGVRGQELTPGEIRTSQNWIGPLGCTLAEASFVPPPPDAVVTALGDLESFLHADPELPLLVKIGLVHAQFETIHPFLDGNGRIGRLLITLLLCEQKVLEHPVLYLSYYFKKHRAEYYERLQAIRDSGEWEEWLTFFLDGVVEVSAQATETARAVLKLREDHRHEITESLGRGAANGHRLLERLFTSPIMSVNNVRDLLGVSYVSANELVRRLVEKEILFEMTGRERNRQFMYRPYTELFRDD